MTKWKIRLAEQADAAFLHQHDHHVAEGELKNLIELGRIDVLEENGCPIAWLRWNLFWDNTPFMNMLYVLDGWRGKGCGRALVLWWEAARRREGYECVMTSSASDEYAQHFYIHLGYRTAGGFFPENEPYELFFMKKITSNESKMEDSAQ